MAQKVPHIDIKKFFWEQVYSLDVSACDAVAK
jgi:hypothetical protein